MTSKIAIGISVLALAVVTQQTGDSPLRGRLTSPKPFNRAARFAEGKRYNLDDFADVGIVIEPLPQPIVAAGVRTTHLEKWVMDACFVAGLKARKGSEMPDAMLTPAAADDDAALKREDSVSRTLDVNVFAVATQVEGIAIIVQINVSRAAFVFPGMWDTAQVYNTGRIFLTRHPEASLEIQLKACMADFLKEWRVCNPAK